MLDFQILHICIHLSVHNAFSSIVVSPSPALFPKLINPKNIVAPVLANGEDPSALDDVAPALLSNGDPELVTPNDDPPAAMPKLD